MPSSRIPSPARSQGARSTPRRYKPRASRSVCSPARSNNSVKLSAVIMSQMDSFVLSPMPTRRSVLADTTDIDMPRRRSWWRKLGENSREIMEVLNSKEPIEADNAIEEYIDVDVLSQEKKNYTFDLPESSDSESISSIIIPQRKLFTQKENQLQKKFGQIINTRESLAKLHKSQAIDEKALNVGPKNLFNQGTKPRSKPIFPSALLNISANKTIANKAKDQPSNEVKGQIRNLFGNKPGTKRKNMFADFIVSESEDEVPVTVSQKLEQKRKASFSNRAEREPSPSSVTDIEMDDWRLLPSSTMVDHQIEEGLRITPNKRARLDKLSEGTESNNTIANKTKQSNKSLNTKNKSKIKEVLMSATQNADKVNDDIDISISQNQTTRKSLRNKDRSLRNASLERSARKENTITKDIKNASQMQIQKVNSNNFAVKNDSKNMEARDKSNQTKTLSKIDQALQSEDDEDDFTLEYDNDDEPVKENETIRENKTQNAQHVSNVGKDNIAYNISKELQKITKENKDQAHKNETYNNQKQVDSLGEGEAEQDQNKENYEKFQNASQEIANYDGAELELQQEEEQYVEEMQENDVENREHNQDNIHTDKQLEKILKITPNKKVRESFNATANKTSQSNNSMNSKNKSKNMSKLNELNEQDNILTVEEAPHYVQEEVQKSRDELLEIENDAGEMELENDAESESEEDEKHKSHSSVQNESQEMATSEEDHESDQAEQENDLQKEQDNDLDANGQGSNAEEQETDQEEQEDEDDLQEQEPDQDNNKLEDDDTEEANVSNQNDEDEVEDDVQDQSSSEVEEDDQEAHNTNQNISQDVENEEEMEDQEESEAEDEKQENDSDHDESRDQADEPDMQDSVQNVSQEHEDDDEETHNESEVQENEEENDNTTDNDINVSQDLEDAEEKRSNHENEEDEVEDDEDDIDADPNDVQSHSQHDVHDEVHDADDNNESEPEEDHEVQKSGNAETNSTHDTTGRHRKKHDPKISSPEAILHDKTREMESFVKGRNTSVRKTKSMIKSLNIRPSLAPVRESTGFSDGSGDSNAEGSGWDSHRTTRVTMRKTFGKDFTPRKSLRTLVMEKSAKRQTAMNLETNAEISKHPQANSTELPEPYDMHDDDDDDVDADDGQDMPESDHEVSRRTRQTTLENYLQKIKQQSADRRKQLDEEIRSALQKNAPRTDVFNFKVPAVPKRRIRPLQIKPKAKPVKSVIPMDMLPPELLEDMKYKPPKRYRPANASWITKRLYKFLESKLEPKYDYKARIRSEKLVETMYNFTKEIRRHTAAPTDAVQLLKHEMARLEIVKTHFEFYEFFHEFMPREVRVKVVPDVFNKISLPKHGVFSDILR